MHVPTLFFKEGGWCEALKTSYQPGVYQPRTEEECRALAPFAFNAQALVVPAPAITPPEDDGSPVAPPNFVDECGDRETLAAYAREHGIEFHHRAGIEKIREAIKAAQ